MTHELHHNHVALGTSESACLNITNMQEFMVEADSSTHSHSTEQRTVQMESSDFCSYMSNVLLKEY